MDLPRDHPECGCFACPVRAEEPGNLALRKFQADASYESASAASLDEAASLERVLRIPGLLPNDEPDGTPPGRRFLLRHLLVCEAVIMFAEKLL
jgi:hypothetical protein